MNDFYHSLEWIKGRSHRNEPFYYFPASMTLIEYDENFGKLLTELEYMEDSSKAESLEGYPEGYTQDVLFNMDALRRSGLIAPLEFPGVPERIPVGRMFIANTMRCNLACTYCYNNFDSNSRSSAEADMSIETFRLAVRFLEEHGAGLPFYDLTFIGGEPLLNTGVIEEAARWGKKLREEGRELFITISTNATLLDSKIMNFCKMHRIHLKLTLDGDQVEHDRNRIYPGGEGSYERIIENLPGYFSNSTYSDRYVATTIDTRKSEPGERAARLADMGFNVIDLAELYSEDEGSSFAGEDALEENFRQKYERLLDFLYLRIKDRNYLHIIPVFALVKNLHMRKPAFTRCRAGVDSFALGPGGTLYPCHHFYGDARFALGTVGGGAIRPDVLAPYRIPVGKRPECSECWARFLCGGPCYHRSLALTGDAFRPGRVECVRIKSLILEVFRFYLRLKDESGGFLDWFLARGMSR